MEITMEIVKLFLIFTLINMIFTIVIVSFWKTDKNIGNTLKNINDLFDVQSSRLDILSDRITQCVSRQQESTKFLNKAVSEATTIIDTLENKGGRSFTIDKDGIKVDGDLERNVNFLESWNRNVKSDSILRNIKKHFKNKNLYIECKSTDDILALVPHNSFTYHCDKAYARINAKKYYKKLKKNQKS